MSEVARRVAMVAIVVAVGVMTSCAPWCDQASAGDESCLVESPRKDRISAVFEFMAADAIIPVKELLEAQHVPRSDGGFPPSLKDIDLDGWSVVRTRNAATPFGDSMGIAWEFGADDEPGEVVMIRDDLMSVAEGEPGSTEVGSDGTLLSVNGCENGGVLGELDRDAPETFKTSDTGWTLVADGCPLATTGLPSRP